MDVSSIYICLKKYLVLIAFSMMLSGCSVFGVSSVEHAPYQVFKSAKNENIELRQYDTLIVVTSEMDFEKNEAFFKLFDYISGNNERNSTVAMTAPVLMSKAREDSGLKISMTAPVLMENKEKGGSMSFVLPSTFTLETTPLPKDPSLNIEELKNPKFATIRFTGLINSSNIEKHRALLELWIEREGYKIAGDYKVAGYNPPFTIPFLRRNEVLIPVNDS